MDAASPARWSRPRGQHGAYQMGDDQALTPLVVRNQPSFVDVPCIEVAVNDLAGRILVRDDLVLFPVIELQERLDLGERIAVSATIMEGECGVRVRHQPGPRGRLKRRLRRDD